MFKKSEGRRANGYDGFNQALSSGWSRGWGTKLAQPVDDGLVVEASS